MPYSQAIWWFGKLQQEGERDAIRNMDLIAIAMHEAMGSKQAGELRRKLSRDSQGA